MGRFSEMKIFGGRAHRELLVKVSRYLKIKIGRLDLYNFSDGEIFCQILENVRGDDVFIVQPFAHPVNENFMELLIMLDALKRASADKVTAVIPYFGYARADKKDKPRVAISAKLVANLLSVAGCDRVITMDLHAAQIQGFFDIPVDHLFARPVIVEIIKSLDLDDEIVIVSPDTGGVLRAREVATRVNAGLAIVDKRRPRANVAETIDIVGEVKGKTAIIIDDIVDTAGTLVKTAELLERKRAKRILAFGIHGVLSGPALERIENSCIEEVYVSDSLPVREGGKIKVYSIAPLIAEAIRRAHENVSISSLFD